MAQVTQGRYFHLAKMPTELARPGGPPTLSKAGTDGTDGTSFVFAAYVFASSSEFLLR